MNSFKYQGSELEIFEHAINWKKYWAKRIAPHLGSKILDIGAGIGSTADYFKNQKFTTWLCVEPDIENFNIILNKLKTQQLPNHVLALNGTISDTKDIFDTILYIDVLEHIEKDYEELVKASYHLRTQGKIIILSPAHNFLFSSFDHQIGHYRRYTKKSLLKIIPANLKTVKIEYLDFCGFFASLANKLFFNSSNPSLNQILFWDRILVKTSRLIDPLLTYRFGKSILCIIEKS